MFQRFRHLIHVLTIGFSQPPGGDTPSATNEGESRNREMPKTACNWLTMLLTGCVLSVTGIALRRAAA